MNEELKKKLLDHAAALTAYANGENVEFEYEWGIGKWHDTPSPYSEISKELCYKFHRIKPRKRLRPFTLEEAHRLVGRVVRPKDDDGSRYLIQGVWKTQKGNITFGLGLGSYPQANRMLCEFELFNSATGEWGPCGVEVGNEV